MGDSSFSPMKCITPIWSNFKLSRCRIAYLDLSVATRVFLGAVLGYVVVELFVGAEEFAFIPDYGNAAIAFLAGLGKSGSLHWSLLLWLTCQKTPVLACPD